MEQILVDLFIYLPTINPIFHQDNLKSVYFWNKNIKSLTISGGIMLFLKKILSSSMMGHMIDF